MTTRSTKPLSTKHVETITHDAAKRKNIPSVEQQSIASQEHIAPKQVRYPRNTDLDPQLVWRGKDEQMMHKWIASTLRYATVWALVLVETLPQYSRIPV